MAEPEHRRDAGHLRHRDRRRRAADGEEAIRRVGERACDCCEARAALPRIGGEIAAVDDIARERQLRTADAGRGGEGRGAGHTHGAGGQTLDLQDIALRVRLVYHDDEIPKAHAFEGRIRDVARGRHLGQRVGGGVLPQLPRPFDRAARNVGKSAGSVCHYENPSDFRMTDVREQMTENIRHLSSVI